MITIIRYLSLDKEGQYVNFGDIRELALNTSHSQGPLIEISVFFSSPKGVFYIPMKISPEILSDTNHELLESLFLEKGMDWYNKQIHGS